MTYFNSKYRQLSWLAIAVLVCQVLLASMITSRFTNAMIDRDAAVIQQMLQEIPAPGQTAPVEALDVAAFAKLGEHIVTIPGIMRANVYAPDRFIRYSSDKNLIGKKFENNEQLEQAMAGRLLVSLEQLSDVEKSEHLALGGLGGSDGELIEAYIPVQDATGKTIAVVEYYKQPAGVRNAAFATSLYVWLASLASALAIIFVSAILLLSRSNDRV